MVWSVDSWVGLFMASCLLGGCSKAVYLEDGGWFSREGVGGLGNGLYVGFLTLVDNHSSGYLGMAVQHCVRAYLGSHCILAQKQYCQKLMAQLNSTAFFLSLYVYFEAK